MKTLHLIQGSPEWDAHRANPFMHNASDAPAMLGCDDKRTRSELMRERASGIKREFSAFVQERVLNKGHRNEAFGRANADSTAGVTFYPVTGESDDGFLSASFDGLTMAEDLAWEHKSLNNTLRAVLPTEGIGGQEVGAALPKKYRVQVEQQLAVSGAERVLFMASTWTDDGQLVEARYCWYYSDAALRAEIIAGWAQFDADLKALLENPEALNAAPAPVVTGRTMPELPALLVQVKGEVLATNLNSYKETALAAIRSINRNLSTDQEFADAKKTVKWCESVEDKLKGVLQNARAQMGDIDALFLVIEEVSAEVRRTRLDLDKLVKSREEQIKLEVVMTAKKAMAAHVADLETELGGARLVFTQPDFGLAAKNKRTLESLRDSVDTALANGKIAASEAAKRIRSALAVYTEQAAGYEFLFADRVALLEQKAPDDMKRLVAERIRTHKEAEERRAEAKRQEEARIAAEAATKAQREEQERAAEAAATQAEAERRKAEAVAAPRAQPEPAPIAAMVQQPVAAPTEEAATVRLGEICATLGVTMTADFVANTLGIPHRATEKAAKLYTKSDAIKICKALAMHATAKASAMAEEFRA